MKNLSVFLVTILVCGCCLTSCGQKGPLYIPQPEQPAPKNNAAAPDPEAKAKPEKTGYKYHQ